MATRQITAAHVRLFKQQTGGGVEDAGEVLFSRIPVRSQSDYHCLLKAVLDLQQAKVLSESLQEHPSDPQGMTAGYVWRR